MLMELLIPVGILGAMGLIFGAGLAIASKVFEVKTDERVPLVRDALPGANCGGCGFPGCDALAAAIVNGEASVNACPVGGAATAMAIGEIMGESIGSSEPMVACIHCNGDCTHSPNRADYYGIQDCRQAMIASGGVKTCRHGCMGLGTCVSACMFGALSIGDNGLPEVDVDKCTACGKCRDACPKGIIDLIPADQLVHVDCRNTDKGKLVRAVCDIGCIACKACVKVCPVEAITVENNLASIDYDKCTQCQACFEKCPTGAITLEQRIVIGDETTVIELEPEKDLDEEMEAIMQVDAEPVEEFVEVSGEIEVLETRENMEEPEKTVDPAEEHPEDEKDKVEFKISDLK
ncbi:electron transport complex, RnfABCDGE type, B subunit [Eubacterium maltosivorans]|uniref:RnfABCDGE type electron transport complex subunit B n=1 Tax=Eubacterium maltosivorans TaxID=2041044 RepID=UPI000886C29E|nr:RnfABCDGE type electron transport complex subunit B [Eubacterium maltosivorans]WPK79840.1 Ion-translocating oxidoreductase complex subunit B [Eubacterium maltosivorans]SDO99541.1 electron transport complex, RnfABCDGE type, B subunit [Eubacterium maltosivorans]